MVSRRALFGLFVGMGVAPLIKLPEAQAAPFPVRGTEPATLKWFNRVRGFGFAQGQLSGHNIFINKSCFEKIDVERPAAGRTYAVSWELKAHGPIASEVSVL